MRDVTADKSGDVEAEGNGGTEFADQILVLNWPLLQHLHTSL